MTCRVRNQWYSLQSSEDELTPVSRCKSRTKNPDHLRSQISRRGGDGEMPFSSRIGAARLTMQQYGKARFRNARENNFACSAKPGSRARLHHLRSLTLTFFLRVTVAPAKCMQHGCLSPTTCPSRPGDAPVASLDDREARPRLLSGTYRVFCNRQYDGSINDCVNG